MDLISVRACTSQFDADQHALVLNALGIKTYMVHEDGVITLFVAMEDAGEALRQLAGYDEEEAARQARARPRFRTRVPEAEAPLLYLSLIHI